MLRSIYKMKIKINKNISISTPIEFFKNTNPIFPEYTPIIEDQYIWIQNKQFKIIQPSELLRKRNNKDGYYRVIYIQINFETGEYYIGKANRPTWKQLERYQGSGLKFKEKYKKHQDQYVRYYIAICKSDRETEQLESDIVNSSLLLDPLCLNLVQGGGGTTRHPSMQELREKKSKYMKSHPERYQSMLDSAKKIFTKDSLALKERNLRISQTMSDEKHREISRNRILKWKMNNPEKYEEARRKNKESIKKKDVQTKRKRSLALWIEKNPEKYQQWQENRIQSLQKKETKEKHKKALKSWVQKNPEKAKENAQKRALASSKVTSKPILMKNLKTGEILREFNNARDAAKWLLCEGKTKSKNAAGSIGAVCLGRRKKAYGYFWEFIRK